MSLMSRYRTERNEIRGAAIARDALIGGVVLILLLVFWPLRTVPTGSRGVITVGGAIRGIEAEGFTLLFE